MSLFIRFPRKIDNIDKAIIELAGFLLELYSGIVLSIEKVRGVPGVNVRIVITDYSYSEKIIKAVSEFEKEKNIQGLLSPEVVSEEDYDYLNGMD